LKYNDLNAYIISNPIDLFLKVVVLLFSKIIWDE
jgi:hypothetical protein